jgi:hypothetical protein
MLKRLAENEAIPRGTERHGALTARAPSHGSAYVFPVTHDHHQRDEHGQWDCRRTPTSG